MLGLAAFLLFAPVFVLPALVMLLIVSGPATIREWWWIAAGALWMLYSAGRELGLFDQTLLAAGVLVTGAFVALMLRRPRPVFQAALLALLIGAAALAFWGLWFGIGWRDVKLAFVHQIWGVARLLTQPEAPVSSDAAGSWLQSYGDELAERAMPMATVIPGLLALSAVGGLAMAWSWYQRVSVRPLGSPLGRLTEFRFSDQMVWGIILGLGLVLAPVPPSLRELGGNLILFFGGLFAFRGLAVTRTWLNQAPGPLLMFMALSLIFIAPVALGGLLSLGLADIWLDFRRRFVPPTVEG